jgi:hypothetical protein
MQPALKKASVWAFSGLFGCISLFGSGWHSFVEHAHHSHDHGSSAPADEHEEAPFAWGAFVNGSSETDHDCPICSFFSQAQWAVHFEPLDFAFAACELSAPVPQAPPIAWAGIYQSRAPPNRPPLSQVLGVTLAVASRPGLRASGASEERHRLSAFRLR